MALAPASPPSSSPPTEPAAREAHSVINWRSVRVLKAGRQVSGKQTLRVLRYLRDNGQVPDGYTLEPEWKAINFLGFEDDHAD